MPKTRFSRSSVVEQMSCRRRVRGHTRQSEVVRGPCPVRAVTTCVKHGRDTAIGVECSRVWVRGLVDVGAPGAHNHKPRLTYL
eukprot:6032391-Prymnesium_polylepis.1